MYATASPSVDHPRAAMWRRFVAMLYDLLPLFGLWIIGAGLWMLAFHRNDDLQHLASALNTPLDRVLRDLWLLAITGSYFVVSWVRVGATIGMRAWKVRVINAAGGRIDVRTALLRFALAVVSLGALGFGFWYAWFDVDHRAWHDRVCGTRVTRL